MNKLLDFFNDITGAQDFVDERRTTRLETWSEEERQAYNQIVKLIEQSGKQVGEKLIIVLDSLAEVWLRKTVHFQADATRVEEAVKQIKQLLQSKPKVTREEIEDIAWELVAWSDEKDITRLLEKWFKEIGIEVENATI